MRMLLLLVLLACSPVAAAIDEVVGARVRVLFADPALEPFAQRVATTADEVLVELGELFGAEPPAVVLSLDGRSDVFNASAPSLPRPTVALRPLFPLRGETGFSGSDALRVLLLHELTHNVHFAFTDRPAKAPPPLQVGLVGEGVAAFPPLWFVEGVATWVESTLSDAGGRLNDARVRGLLASLALEGSWPELTDASLGTYAPWPGGQTRYLLGAAFIEHLVARHGFEALRATLRGFNSSGLLGDFAGAWRAASGSDLYDEWEAFRRELSDQAEGRAAGRDQAELLTDSGGLTGLPAVAPDGRHLAWVSWPPAIAVAELSAGGLAGTRQLRSGVFPSSLDWLDDETLIYTRIDWQAASDYSELFTLDLASGRERRLTVGARASFARAGADGCILFVRDVETDGSSLRQWCQADGVSELWRAPVGSHLVGLDVGVSGRVVVSLWRAGQVDLALIDDGSAVFLTEDRWHDIDPAWVGAETLHFASDRGGIYELYELTLAADGQAATVQRRSSSLGGSFQAAGGAAEVFVRLGPEGYDLARLDPQIGDDVAFERVAASGAPAPVEGRLPTRSYRPLASLAPFGWLPTAGALEVGPVRAALELSVLGQDDSGEHSYALAAGYDTARTGHLAGGHAAFRYAYREAGLVGTIQPRGPLSAAVRVGVWPHIPHLVRSSETALGIEVEAGATLLRDPVLRSRLRVGLVHLQSAASWQPEVHAELRLSRQFADTFGYRTRGPGLTVTAVWSATSSGPSAGVWVDGAWYLAQPFGVPGTGEIALRTGFRQAPPVPLQLEEFAAVATVGYRHSVPVSWRYGDGRYAFERLTLEPRVRLWVDGRFGAGADLSAYADTVVSYGAPVSFGLRGGYAQSWWWGLVFSLPR